MRFAFLNFNKLRGGGLLVFGVIEGVVVRAVVSAAAADGGECSLRTFLGRQITDIFSLSDCFVTEVEVGLLWLCPTTHH